MIENRLLVTLDPNITADERSAIAAYISRQHPLVQSVDIHRDPVTAGGAGKGYSWSHDPNKDKV